MSRPVAEAPVAPPDSPAPRGGYRALLRNRAFLRLWLAQAISQTAQQIINFALLIEVRQLIEQRGVGGGNTALSLLIICFATPPILFSALAGVVVDRSNKRFIMAAVNALRALCITGYLLLNPGWPVLHTLAYIYALCILFSTVGQLFGPAEGATIPLLVPANRLLSANGLFSLTYTASQILGFVMLGPLLTSVLRLPVIYVLVVALYLVCTVLILTLPPTPAGAPAGRHDRAHSILGDLRELWRYVGRNRLLRKGIAYLTLANAGFLMIAALAPEFIGRELGLAVTDLAIVVLPAGLGMVGGVIALGRLGRRLDRERLIDRALLGASLCLLAFSLLPRLVAWLTGGGATAPVGRTDGLSPLLLLEMIVAVGIGLANALLIVPSQTLLQEQSTEQIRGRVLSAFFTTSNAAALVPILFAGVLGDLFGVTRVLIALALLLLAIALRAEWLRRRRARPPAHR